jgi:hypothetical protein
VLMIDQFTKLEKGKNMKSNQLMLLFASILTNLMVLANSSTANAGYHEQVLNCDNGAAVVDRNTLSPKYPQVVIRQTEIVNYLKSQGVSSNDKGEVILNGINDLPVYAANDFHGFTDLGSGTYRNDWVRREGQGIRVSFNRFEPFQNSDCGLDIQMSNPSCGGGMWKEVASWTIQSCY